MPASDRPLPSGSASDSQANSPLDSESLSEPSFADSAPIARHAVVCLSGGMDSTSLLLRLLAQGLQVFGISYDYGQKHHLELERLQQNLDYLRDQGYSIQHRSVDMSVLGQLYHSALVNADWQVPEGFYEQDNMKETVVPNRNAIFASIAYGYALSIANQLEQPVALALGVHSGDHAIYPDCRPEFYQSLMKSFALGNWDAQRVELYLPYLHGDKITILKDALTNSLKLNIDFDTVMSNTSTSYAPDAQGRASGRTGSDVERVLAFDAIGRVDPIPYADSWENVLAYARRCETEARSGNS